MANKLFHEINLDSNLLSTIHPHLKIIDYITGALNNNKFAVAVFIDLRKAFDIIDLKIPVSKVTKYDIKNTNLN